MGTYADTSNIVDGQTNDAADVKAPIDALDAELVRRLKYARVYRSTNQTLTTSTFTTLTFDSERFDTDAFHSTSSNTSRLTAPLTAKYRIGASVAFVPNATGIRQLLFQVNGATIIALATQSGVATFNLSITLSALYALAASDYVEIVAYQSSGGNLDVLSAAAYSPEFWIEIVG